MNPSVVHVLNSAKIGGTESWVLDFIAASEPALKNHVILFRSGGALSDEYRRHEATVLSRGGRFGRRVRTLLELRAAVRASGAAEVWLHSDRTRLYGAWLPKRLRRAAVCHSPWGLDNVDLRLGFGRGRQWDRIVLVSDELYRRACVTHPHIGSCIQVVPPPRLANDGAMVSLNVGNPVRLVYVARLVDGKGHAALLEAFRLVRPALAGIKLVIVGDGPLMSELVGLSTSLGLGTDVEFTGELLDPKSVLLGADLFVHPSLSEGLSRSGLEAAMLGLPIVAHSLEVHRSFVEDGVTGLFVDASDVEALSDGIIVAVNRLSQLRQAARSHAIRLRQSFSTNFDESISEIGRP